MNSKKLRLASAILLTIFAVGCSSCGKIVEEPAESLSIYASFYPIYALTCMVAGNVPDLTLHCMTEPQDGCLRDYQISDRDLYLLAYSADAVVLAGGGLESFSDALTGESNTQIAVLKLLEGLELIEGSSDEEDSHFDGSNPYLYMSIDGAVSMIQNAAAGFSVLDPEYEEIYNENAEESVQTLEALKSELLSNANCANGIRAALLAEPMFYIAEMYGMEIVCTYERECGQIMYDSEIEDCLEMLRASEVQLVLLEAQVPKKLENAIQDAGFAVAKIDCMMTHTESDGSQGYITAQRENAEAIIAAIRGE